MKFKLTLLISTIIELVTHGFSRIFYTPIIALSWIFGIAIIIYIIFTLIIEAGEKQNKNRGEKLKYNYICESFYDENGYLSYDWHDIDGNEMTDYQIKKCKEKKNYKYIGVSNPENRNTS